MTGRLWHSFNLFNNSPTLGAAKAERMIETDFGERSDWFDDTQGRPTKNLIGALFSGEVFWATIIRSDPLWAG